VRKVNHAAKTVVLYTAEGGDETVGLAEHTVVHGVTSADSAVDAYARDALEARGRLCTTPETVRTRRRSLSIPWAADG
jgi:hypothetical protein